MALANLMARIRLEGVEATQRGLAQVKQGFHQAGEAAKSMGGHATAAMRDLARGMVDVAQKATLLGGALAVGGGVAAYDVAVKMDTLTRALASTATNAEDLRQQLARLKEVARLPGLGFEEAIQGSVKLQAAGLSASLAERSLKAFGNALALAGGGKAQLDGTITALSQIASKGKLSAEEINQIAERVPQIRQLLSQAFGTADTEKIQKMGLGSAEAIERIVAAAEKLPKATGGFQNAMENFQDGLKVAIEPLGIGIAKMFDAASPVVNDFLGFLEDRMLNLGEVFIAFGKSGVVPTVLQSYVDSMDRLLGGDFQTGMIKVFSQVAAFAEAIPSAFEVAAKMAYMIGVNVQKSIGYLVQMAPLVGELIGNTFKTAFGGGLSSEAIGKDGNIQHGSLLLGLGEKGMEFLAKGFMKSKLGKVLMSPTAKGLAVDLLGIGLGERILSGGMEALGHADESGRTLRERFGDVKTPDFYSLEDLGAIWNQRPTIEAIMARAAMFEQATLSSLGVMGDLPDDLNFKTGIMGGGVSSEEGAGPIERLLMNIEKNTKQQADALSLRAQTLGGGELAGLGVTAAELRAAGVSGFAPENFDYLPRIPSNQMERAYRQIAREEQRRAAGKGRIF